MLIAPFAGSNLLVIGRRLRRLVRRNGYTLGCPRLRQKEAKLYY
jgi:hypothetical protein